MNPLLFLLSACAAVVVLATPHHIARHDALAARIAPAIPDDAFSLRRRQRCRPRPSSSEDLSPTPRVDAGTPSSTQSPSPTPTIPDYLPTTTLPVNTPTPVPTTTTLPIDNTLPSFLAGSGQGTWYETGLGACGFVSGADDFIVALSHSVFDPFTPNGNPNLNSLCNRMISVTLGTTTITVKVVDLCDGCVPGQLDFSKGAFTKLAPLSVGRILDLSWHFV